MQGTLDDAEDPQESRLKREIDAEKQKYENEMIPKFADTRTALLL